MTTTTASLTDFLLARIAEDEAVARDAQHQAAMGRPFVTVSGGGTGIRSLVDPARALAECAAKRKLIHLYEATSEGAPVHADAWTAMKIAVRYVAAVYSDHPDYRADWA